MYSVHTPAGYDYNRMWLSVRREVVEFEVMACSDVHIALTDEPGKTSETSTYEIVIGGFTNSRFVKRIHTSF